jgi:hypothetical protein
MEENTKFESILKEVNPYIPTLEQASDSILSQDVSKYPIFVVHPDLLEIGIELIYRSKNGGKWSVHASTLEEFSTKQIINQEKVENFISIFKDPQTHLCLFILSELGANFIFVPRMKKS